MKRILPLYIIREILPPFFISLLVFTFILLMAKVLELTELVVVRGVSATTIFSLVGLSLPYFFSLTIPMATLLAVLLAFLRLSGDSEITVMKSAGIGLYQLLPPVILFCLWTYLVTSFLTLYLVPAANASFRNQLLALAKARADVGIKERVFNDNFGEMVLYVNHIPLDSDMMEDLFIKDERDQEMPSVIVASRGRIAMDTNRRALIFQLFNGVIDRVNRETQTTETITFRRYEVKLDLGIQGIRGAVLSRDQYELPLDELWTAAYDLKEKNDLHYTSYFIEAHRRLSLPFACVVLGLVAVPLGIQSRLKGRNWGVIMGLIIFLVYYLILTAGRSFGGTGAYPPALGMWMPNIVIGALAVSMIRRANSERPIRLVSVANWLTNVKKEDDEDQTS